MYSSVWCLYLPVSCVPGLEIHPVGVSAWGYNRLPYMRPPLTQQEDEIEPETCDARANNRNHWSIRVPQVPLVNIVYLLTFIRCMFEMK